MAKEGEPPQMALFSPELTDFSPSSMVALAEPEIGEAFTEAEDADREVVPIDSCPGELERPTPTIREFRAVRSLLYNRLLMEVVQRRIEKAEAIILSYLLTQADSFTQIGPYFVELGEDHLLEVTKTEDGNGWYQLYFSEIEKPSRPNKPSLIADNQMDP